jgi:hypothetical protein
MPVIKYLNVFTCEKYLFGHSKEKIDDSFEVESANSIEDHEVLDYLNRNA